MPNPLLACSRMYNVSPAVARLWAQLFDQISRQSGIALRVAAHAAPAPLEQLWERADLGLVFLCGRPFLQYGCRHRPVAVPVPARPCAVLPPAVAPFAQSKALYRSFLLVRDADGPPTLEASFGSRLGFMPPHSQSGYNALRYRLAAFISSARPRLYAQARGPYPGPAALLQALQKKEIDIAPMDSYSFELYLRHTPEQLADVRIVDATDWTPMPFLAASPQTDAASCAALREALLSLNDANNLLEPLCLEGFAEVPLRDYALLAEQEARALAAGYPCPC